MRAGEAFKWLNLAAGTYDAGNQANAPAGAVSGNGFTLQGGTYQVGIICTGTPALAIQQLGADNTTWEPLYIAPDSAPGTPINSLVTSGIFGKITVPPGRFKIVVQTSTANYVTLTRIPTSE